MKKNIQPLLIYVALNIFLYLLIFLSVAMVELEHKKSIAEATLNLTREHFLTGDNRSVSKNIDKVREGNFYKIEAFGKNNQLITSSFATNSEFYIKFKKSIWVDASSSRLKGYLIFYIGINHLLLLALKILFLTFIASGPMYFGLVIFYRKRQKVIIENENFKLKEQITQQVSHDIRSPLAALKAALEDSEGIPLEKRAMFRSSIQRINDIANNLINQGKIGSNNSQMSTELLAPLVDSLVSEKRIQYRHKIDFNIEADLTRSFGLFVDVNQAELKRVLSNLINNSIEAMNEVGNVKVSIAETTSNMVSLKVIDNGKGMSEQTLKKLGEKGFTYGKNGIDAGSGLGFHHAIQTIKSFNGKIDVNSKHGEGTSVNILLKKATKPVWFADKLNHSPKTKILILDDDESMLQVWQNKFSVKTEVFTSGEEFSQAVKLLSTNDFIAIVDFELLGQSMNGIEIIQQLKIVNNSIIVTSRFAEPPILEKCLSLGVRIIPKSMVSAIPIQQNINELYEYVLIDNDPLVRMTWEMKAKKKNIKLLTLSSAIEFESHVDKIDKNRTVIYIDSDLGDNSIKGEEFATTLHTADYKSIFIATGYEKIRFSHLPWLGYSRKDCPF